MTSCHTCHVKQRVLSNLIHCKSCGDKSCIKCFKKLGGKSEDLCLTCQGLCPCKKCKKRGSQMNSADTMEAKILSISDAKTVDMEVLDVETSNVTGAKTSDDTLNTPNELNELDEQDTNILHHCMADGKAAVVRKIYLRKKV
jgi:hypothetical protein